MIPKGAGSIRSLHSLNTRPGAQSQPDILRRMYILACEKAHLEKKTEWLKRQGDQTVRRLGEIGHALGFLKNRVSKEERDTSRYPSGYRKETMKGNSGGKFNSVPLRY